MSQLDMFRCKYECLWVYCVVVTTRAAMKGRRHSVLIVVAPPCVGDTLVDVVPCGGCAVVGLGLAFVRGKPPPPLPSGKSRSSSSSSLGGCGTGLTVGLVGNCEALPLQRSLPEQKQYWTPFAILQSLILSLRSLHMRSTCGPVK